MRPLDSSGRGGNSYRELAFSKAIKPPGGTALLLHHWAGYVRDYA
jgi:hypothetical protein